MQQTMMPTALQAEPDFDVAAGTTLALVATNESLLAKQECLWAIVYVHNSSSLATCMTIAFVAANESALAKQELRELLCTCSTAAACHMYADHGESCGLYRTSTASAVSSTLLTGLQGLQGLGCLNPKRERETERQRERPR